MRHSQRAASTRSEPTIAETMSRSEMAILSRPGHIPNMQNNKPADNRASKAQCEISPQAVAAAIPGHQCPGEGAAEQPDDDPNNELVSENMANSQLGPVKPRRGSRSGTAESDVVKIGNPRQPAQMSA